MLQEKTAPGGSSGRIRCYRRPSSHARQRPRDVQIPTLSGHRYRCRIRQNRIPRRLTWRDGDTCCRRRWDRLLRRPRKVPRPGNRWQDCPRLR